MKILYLPNEYSQQRQYEKPANIYPVLMAMEAEWYRKQGHEVIWGGWETGIDKTISEPEGLPFLSLPHPDRIFTRWWEYQNNGNFKYLPATYIQSARDCWWHNCTFCSWAKKYPNYEVREVDDVIDEIKEIKEMKFREVFDDSGTFPIGRWLDEFIYKFSKFNKSIRISCNMRLIDCDYSGMYNAGFRMVLFGLESGNQTTLDKINKGVKVEDIIPTIKKASEAGLEPHIAGMVGYPWESEEDCLRTVRLFRYLLSRGYAKTAQMSFYCPPPNQEQGNKQHLKHLKGIYYVTFNPLLWCNKIIDIKSMDDFNYLIKSIKEGWRGIWGRKSLN